MYMRRIRKFDPGRNAARRHCDRRADPSEPGCATADLIDLADRRPPAGCVHCKKAVETAYWGMIALGHGHFRAFRIADRVFRWHLPEASDPDREASILCWIQSSPPN
jgi:hypothetical protein